MVQGFAQDAGGLAARIVQVAQLVQIGHVAAGRVQAVLVLQLAREFLAQQGARVADEAGQAVAGGLVEGHGEG